MQTPFSSDFPWKTVWLLHLYLYRRCSRHILLSASVYLMRCTSLSVRHGKTSCHPHFFPFFFITRLSFARLRQDNEWWDLLKGECILLHLLRGEVLHWWLHLLFVCLPRRCAAAAHAGAAAICLLDWLLLWGAEIGGEHMRMSFVIKAGNRPLNLSWGMHTVTVTVCVAL